MGYAGGSAPDPTYRRIGDHTECFQVEFDPQVVSYEDLLALFWSSHDPTSPSYSRQYASLVLAHDERQLALAQASRDRLETVLQRPVLTRIEMLQRFYPAEEYHQKYHWKQFAAQWERVKGTEVPGWDSPEFARWLSTGVVRAADADMVQA